MFNKEMTEQILKGIVWLNEKMGAWSFILPVVFAVGVLYFLIRAYRNPSVKNSRLLLAAYALVYVFGGWTIFIGKDFMGTGAAIGGAVGLWSISFFLILDIFFKWTEIKVSENRFLKFTSWFFIIAGIFLYPILEIALGFTYPRMVFFGAECPTTISLIGLFIGSVPRVNKPLFILISLNAIFTGGSVAINGAGFDFLYAFAGLAGTAVILLYFKDIFLIKRNVNGNS